MLIDSMSEPDLGYLKLDPDTGKYFNDFRTYDDANDPPTPGHEVFLGGSRHSKVYAGGGNDRFLLQALNDWADGGPGNDYFDGGSGSDTIYGGIGDDDLRGSVDKDYLYGGEGSDTLYGSGNTPFFTDGYDGGNYLEGNEGDDTFYGHGKDTLIGSIGNDVYNVDTNVNSANGADTIEEYDEEGFDTVNSSVDYTLGNNLEYLQLTGENAINGTGNELGNSIYGNAANNTIKGGNGNDSLWGAGGDDNLIGEAGNDLLYDSYGSDTLTGGIGNDTYDVGRNGEPTTLDLIVENLNEGTDSVDAYVDYELDANLEGLTLLGSATWGGGNDLNNTIYANWSTDNWLEARNGADKIFGGNGNDTIYGEGGDDIVYASGGTDFIYGGTGNDTYEVWGNVSGPDIATVFEYANEGTDTVRSYTSFTLNDNLQHLELIDWGSVDVYTATGNALANTIRGSAANNILDGAGDNDRLIAGDGVDTLIGGTGNDSLTGGAGADKLTGSTGNDKFVFDTGAAFNKSTIGIDTITDFTRGADKIVLDKTTFTALSTLSFTSVSTLAQAQTSSARITYIQSAGSLFYNQNGSSSGFGTGAQFADLTDGLVLAASDFLVQA